jgi:glycerol-1-phosphate dehydrogenase [NAD(P)+]
MLAAVMDLFGSVSEQVARQFRNRSAELPQAYFCGEDASARLAEHLVRNVRARSVTVLFDHRTRQAAGSDCLRALEAAGAVPHEMLVPDGSHGTSPVCDDLTKDALAVRIAGADACLAVGSGVITDLTKWLAAFAGLPFAVFATAASMNGYTSANVAPTIRGLKSLVRAKAPVAVATDPAVLAGAPYELTAAGLGDVIAKPVSTADWLMNHTLFAEPYSPSIASIIDSIEPSYLHQPQALLARAPNAIRGLFEALLLSGCAMTLQGSSLPASGGEHLVSHTLDMLSSVHRDGHDLHGRQVGVATIFVAALYERILLLQTPHFRPDAMPFEPEVWGPLAASVREHFGAKQQAMRAACEALSRPGQWQELRATLQPKLRTPDTIKTCLRKAGAAHGLHDIGCSRSRFLDAVRHCASMRGRFTSIDLAWATGVLPGEAEAIVDAWLA